MDSPNQIASRFVYVSETIAPQKSLTGKLQDMGPISLGHMARMTGVLHNKISDWTHLDQDAKNTTKGGSLSLSSIFDLL